VGVGSDNWSVTRFFGHNGPVTNTQNGPETTSNEVVILGGGPGGYEAALVAAQLGAGVTVVDTDGLGGSAVLTDCVPSKTLIATAELMSELREAPQLGISFADSEGDVARHVKVDLAEVNKRVKELATSQSDDIAERVRRENVRVVSGRGRLLGNSRVGVELADGGHEELRADAILVATGAAPRTLPTAQPDGERILTWEQVYDLEEVPSKLIVVGSGVTGAEFASAYLLLGVEVVLVSSRDRVLPGEDADASAVLEEVLRRRGMDVMSKSRMESVTRDGDEVVVTLTDGRQVTGSHCLLALGSIPNTADIGLEEAGVTLDEGGFIKVDRVSRTSARGVYAAGDCTGVLMLASVAAMQGRIAMWHFLGDAVQPLDLNKVSSNVFTSPEIATVGWSQQAIDEGKINAEVVRLDLAGNPRAKMQGIHDGFVKLFCRPGTRIVIGGVVVGPRASELIHPISLAVSESLTADQVAHAFTVYPSISGSIAEAARRLHHPV
jgi:pyruvate/2-oxoglutarate dehydrogenase complex dihydrolipoamide dehydrogenase (E3) component